MHIPVLVHELVDWLRPMPGRLFLDATVGLGGHAEALLERLLPGGRLVGLDRDPEALVLARQRLARFAGHFDLVQGDFRDLAEHAARLLGRGADGVVMDLGVSSYQLERADRGFSFSLEGELDMRMDPTRGRPAWELLAHSRAEALERILREYGEERYARRIARALAERRGRLRTTRQLAELIESVVPRREARLHPATRTFQALRIAVNDELGALEAALRSLPRWLAPGGRLGVIAFHSLEDRIVKQALRAHAAAGAVAILTRKPVRPTEEEVAANPRARSARLREAERRCSAEGG
jgi:16S rRNA (cytosine1402-N4)-methyltransferase